MENIVWRKAETDMELKKAEERAEAGERTEAEGRAGAADRAGSGQPVCEPAEGRKKSVDLIIPVYRPGKSFKELLKRIREQDYPIRRIIIMNTEKQFWKPEYEEIFEKKGTQETEMEVHHLSREEFDHGGTRDRGIRLSDADVCILMTHDAVPADRKLVGNLIKALESGPDIAAAYARQLPFEDCSLMEKYTRAFNYPAESRIKSAADLKELGIKTFFCSNVCAAYDTAIYRSLGGFIKKTIFNEDMIYAAKAVENGYRIAYAADARVFHSHNYTAVEQFHRNFDLAVSQADHPEVFSGIRSEGEGIRLVRRTAAFLVRQGKWMLLPKLAVHSGFKYAGYLLGKQYKRLPRSLVLWLTMNKNYWN